MYRGSATFHKIIGRTSNQVAIDLFGSQISYSQVLVALSRVKDVDDLHFLLPTVGSDAYQKILQKQEKIQDMLKNKIYSDKSFKGKKWLPQILIVISDHADNPRALHRAGGILEALFVRSRHFDCSCWCDSKALKLLSPSVRLNLAGLAVFRLRSMHALQSILDEYSALGVDTKDLLAMYKAATKEPYSFLYVNLLAGDLDKMFFKRFEARLVPGRQQEEQELV